MPARPRREVKNAGAHGGAKSGGAAVSSEGAAAARGCGRLEARRLASSLIVGGVVSDECVPDEGDITGGLRVPLGVPDPVQHADKRRVQLGGVVYPAFSSSAWRAPTKPFKLHTTAM